MHALVVLVGNPILFAVNKEFSLGIRLFVNVLYANGMTLGIKGSEYAPLQSFVQQRILKKIEIFLHKFGCHRRTARSFLTLRIPRFQIPILKDFEN